MSAAEFVTRLFGELPSLAKDEDELRALWSLPDTRKALLDSLAQKGYGREQLREIERMIDAEKSDLYDVLAYIAFALAPITRQERADASRPFISAQYGPKLQAFLDFVLSQYVRRTRPGPAAASSGAEISRRQRCGIGGRWRRENT
jgi:type I restriction enzyme R subunit